MSSHHIVKEKQEPALLITGLTNFNQEWLGQLLEWSPTVIATAATATQLISNDIHIDWLFTEDTANVKAQLTTQTIYSTPQQWITDALQLLITKSYPAVNIITDDFTPDTYLPFIDQINMVIYHQQQKVYAIKSGFEKWMPAGSIIQIINAPANLQCKNLVAKNSIDYTVQQDGIIKVVFTAKSLFIAELL